MHIPSPHAFDLPPPCPVCQTRCGAVGVGHGRAWCFRLAELTQSLDEVETLRADLVAIVDRLRRRQRAVDAAREGLIGEELERQFGPNV